MNITRLKRQHVPDVASLHKRYIDRGFLSDLGNAFLERLYDCMITSDNACCMVAEDAGELHGFISGTYELKMFYKDFLKANLLPVSILLLPRLMNPSVFRKIFETLIYPSRQNKMPRAELLSIVVGDKFRGKGIGEILFKSLAAEFRERGVSEFKVVVGSKLPAANRFYLKMGGHPYADIKVHNNEVSRIYLWKLP